LSFLTIFFYCIRTTTCPAFHQEEEDVDSTPEEETSPLIPAVVDLTTTSEEAGQVLTTLVVEAEDLAGVDLVVDRRMDLVPMDLRDVDVSLVLWGEEGLEEGEEDDLMIGLMMVVGEEEDEWVVVVVWEAILH
jgi:hypothetical protein